MDKNLNNFNKNTEGDDGMIRQSIVYQTSIEKLKEAKQKRLQRKNIGSDEEYLKTITNEYKHLEGLRGRASTFQL